MPQLTGERAQTNAASSAILYGEVETLRFSPSDTRTRNTEVRKFDAKKDGPHENGESAGITGANAEYNSDGLPTKMSLRHGNETLTVTFVWDDEGMTRIEFSNGMWSEYDAKRNLWQQYTRKGERSATVDSVQLLGADGKSVLLNGLITKERYLEACQSERQSVSKEIQDERLKLDGSGKRVTSIIIQGRVYENRGKSNEIGDMYSSFEDKNKDVFVNPDNPVQPLGVYLTYDQKSHAITLQDRATGIRQTYHASGLETTEYPGAGKTTRNITGNMETIVIETKNRATRKMVIRGDVLNMYTDGEGTVYRLLREDPATQKQIYVAVNRQGSPVGNQFTITADRSGNVVVRDESRPQSETYARRELNNGTVITSAKDNSKRRVVNAEGIALDPASREAIAAQESPVVSEVPERLDLGENIRKANRHFTGHILHWSYENISWFENQVRAGGPWDFKFAGPGRMNHPEFESFGNWHYGFVGSAAGFSLLDLQREAGAIQKAESVSRGDWGHAGYGLPLLRIAGSNSFGDDPRDQEQIKEGYEAYKARLRRQNKAVK